MSEYAAIVPVVDHAQNSRSTSRMRAVSAVVGLAMLATVALLAATGTPHVRCLLGSAILQESEAEHNVMTSRRRKALGAGDPFPGSRIW